MNEPYTLHISSRKIADTLTSRLMSAYANIMQRKNALCLIAGKLRASPARIRPARLGIWLYTRLGETVVQKKSFLGNETREHASQLMSPEI